MTVILEPSSRALIVEDDAANTLTMMKIPVKLGGTAVRVTEGEGNVLGAFRRPPKAGS